jgi:hypothetical protein
MTLLDHRERATDPDPDALIEEAREVTRRRRRRWASALAVAVGALIAAGLLAFGGGGDPPTFHGKAPVALHGPLPAGITARVADPGGGLPWGIRLVRTGGYSCLQLGRLSGDQLGMVGIDRMFHDDSEFHPFAVSSSYHATCAQNDGAGHAFFAVMAGSQPASGALSGYTPSSGCDAPSELAGLTRLRHRVKVPASFDPQACPAGDLRFIQYGLLGPEATSITYSYNGHLVTEKTAGPDGAFLVVGPVTSQFCGQLPRYGMCGNNGYSDSLLDGMVKAVQYRNGKTCAATNSKVPAIAQSCPNLGYVAPARNEDTGIASPVKARAVTAKHYCFQAGNPATYNYKPAPATKIGPYIPCSNSVPSNEIRAQGDPQGTDIIFSFTARKASTVTSAYAYEIARTGSREQNCSGGGGGIIEGRVRVGEHITRSSFDQGTCTGTFNGTIYYYPQLGPQGIENPNIFERFGKSTIRTDIVGTFRVKVR